MNRKVLHTLEFDKIIENLTDHASTPSGRELCRTLEPMTHIDDIRLAQRETSDAVSRIIHNGPLSFSGVHDIRGSLKRLQIGGVLGMSELLHISSLLSATARVKSYGRSNMEDGIADSLTEAFSLLEPLTPLNQEIQRCILSEEEMSDDASSGLRHVRRSIRVTGERIHSQLNTLLNGNRAYLQDAVITTRDGRYCLPVKAEYKAQVPGMIHDQSSTGSTYFIEPMAVIRLNNELRELEAQEQKEIEAVLAVLSSSAAEQAVYLESDYELLGRLDFIFARAALSAHYKCTEPVFNTEGYLYIKDARHPLLDPRTVVPITAELGKEFDLLIITGPNTGGKTVSLKTVGLFTLMGQSGLHIPAFEGSQLAVFDEVFADIGDEQSIEQSLSTFSSHMTNIVSILEKADSRSLVLFDELGAGTDPTEGAALAISILTFLHNMKVRTMATTHYSELKVYALSTDGVENACCEFDVDTLRPTYRLLIGIPGKSNAFAISKKLGLPEYIIEDARKRIGSEDTAFEDLLSDLEKNRVELERERLEVNSYKAEIAMLREQLSKKQDRLDENREKILARANEEARKILADAKASADETIRNINRLSTKSGVGKELEKERKKLRDHLDKVNSSMAVKAQKPKKAYRPEDFRVGDAVRVLSMNLNGTVSTLPNPKGEVTVQMGILRSQVNIKDLELLQEDTISTPIGNMGKKEIQKNGHSGSIRMSKSSSVSPEINLIGKTTDEAIPELDKYIDDAYLAHLPQVRVIHGRGTGALKNAVHQFLRRCRHVSSYRLGDFGEGGTGVTIVQFSNDK
ncbi:endonuclease MutS2 [Qiania dongpingensis]|uniref:Endonuclease MutS2 n=1 Tax=Qiania dongpingensis TaxID=2763669 RepID=A0A7G9G1K8_9FIRM|nr:endonuclease MutS2 [Qiania dongpingensis]QNM04690.1 endonuclease MutS2 [Qiania dongpingensis]